MSSFFSGTELYLLLLFSLLLGLLFYNHVSRVQWTESDRRRVEAANLNLHTIYRLLDAPDTRHLLRNPRTRLHVFKEYSDILRRDVLRLVKRRELRPSTIGLSIAFFVVYYLLRLKAMATCGQGDLLFLSQLEVAILRSVAR